jgi:hypothetical protein
VFSPLMSFLHWLLPPCSFMLPPSPLLQWFFTWSLFVGVVKYYCTESDFQCICCVTPIALASVIVPNDQIWGLQFCLNAQEYICDPPK